MDFQYEVAVIGGGPGGLACAREAGLLLGPGKVVLFDLAAADVSAASSWVLGGTSANAGCVAKKLMHAAGSAGEAAKSLSEYGWKGEGEGGREHDWGELARAVAHQVRAGGWSLKRSGLPGDGVKLEARRVRFVRAGELEMVDAKGEIVGRVTARKIVIACGARPRVLDIPGAREMGITSEELFRRKEAPGRTLVVGASFVGVECAGILRGLKVETTMMVRSQLLRECDRELAEMVGADLAERGVKTISGVQPTRLERASDGKAIRVYFSRNEKKEEEEEEEEWAEFDTVLFAVGRQSEVHKLNAVEAIGLKVTPNGQVPVHDEQTNVEDVFCIGDACHGVPQLAPVAAMQGRFLARRLFGPTPDRFRMHWNLIPCVLLTPLEYGWVGLSEEAAIAQHGADDVEVYVGHFTPPEWVLTNRPANACFCKLIVHLSNGGRVIGFHYLGDNAGEVTQGYALSMKLGATFDDFVHLVGIHPTAAEEFTTLTITKRSGKQAKKTGCGPGGCS